MDRVFRTFIDSLYSNTDIPALGTAMTGIAAALDLGTFAYLFVGRQSNAEVKLISNYPTAWTSHYLANGYEEIDPVIDRVVRTREPFQWGCECWSHQICDPQFQLLEDAAHF
ncbi:MAG: autoinducer binding domain-containing protein, partial [Hyphomicrobiales bacterium]|nr:autoinducer binding domain-containing protein [Hyphomicrobiales bacterium]